jgi:hypothetical protein
LIWGRGLLWYLLLVGANVLLLWGILSVWWGEGKQPDSAKSRPGLELPRAPPLRDSQPLTAFQVVSGKNLFSQERTGPEGSSTKKAQGSLESGTLLGVVIVGDERAALIGQIAPQGGPREVQAVRIGEVWGGMKVLEIATDSVIFQGKDGTKTMGFPE